TRRLELAQFLAGGRVPQPDLLPPRGGQSSGVGRQGQGRDVGPLLPEAVELLAAGRVPDAYRAVLGGGRGDLAVRGQGDRLKPAVMPVPAGPFLAGGGVPELNRGPLAARDD